MAVDLSYRYVQVNRGAPCGCWECGSARDPEHPAIRRGAGPIFPTYTINHRPLLYRRIDLARPGEPLPPDAREATPGEFEIGVEFHPDA